MHFAWEELTAGVHRCRLPFCDVTVGLVFGRTGTLLVDTGTTLAEAAAIDADVRRIAERPVTHVVLTHKHFDHVLGSSGFADAELYCAPEVVEYLATATEELRADALGNGADAGEIDRAIAALRPPQHGIYDAVINRRGIRRPFLISEQECVLCGPNGVGRWRWVFSGGPACLVVVVGVSVGQNCGTVVWCSVPGQVWPVECPHASAVGCGVLPADA